MSTLAATIAFVLVAAGSLSSTVACVAPQREETADADVGEARQAVCRRLLVQNVTVLPGTLRWADPAHLLNSAEGFGPRTLEITVATSVAPTVSVTGTHTPEDSEISTAVGFDVTKDITLAARSNILVPTGAYRQIQAYPTFQQATWDILIADCWGWGTTTLVGSGVVYKPIGVYFETYSTFPGVAIGEVVTGKDPIPIDPGSTVGWPVVTGGSTSGVGGGWGMGGGGSGGSGGSGGQP